MKLTIEKQEEKPIVDRTEITAKITDFDATPSNAEVQEEIAKILGKPQALVVIKHIYQHFGEKTSRILAYIYTDENSLKKFEEKIKRGKKLKSAGKETAEEKPAEETKKEEAPSKESKTEEAKPEEKKEEKPAEEKKS